jgi:hypothetical protein
MAIRPSYKLERSDKHGLVEVERLQSGGIDIDIWDVGLVEEGESFTLALSHDEATELAAMLRSVLGQGLSSEDAITLGIDGNEPVAV